MARKKKIVVHMGKKAEKRIRKLIEREEFQDMEMSDIIRMLIKLGLEAEKQAGNAGTA